MQAVTTLNPFHASAAAVPSTQAGGRYNAHVRECTQLSATSHYHVTDYTQLSATSSAFNRGDRREGGLIFTQWSAHSCQRPAIITSQTTHSCQRPAIITSQTTHSCQRPAVSRLRQHTAVRDKQYHVTDYTQLSATSSITAQTTHSCQQPTLSRHRLHTAVSLSIP